MQSTKFKLNSPRKKSNKKKILLATALLLVLVGAIVAGVLYSQHRADLANKQARQKEVDESQTNSAKKNQETQGGSGVKSSGSPSLTTSDTIPAAPSASVAITEFSQANGRVSATAVISGGQATICVFSYTAQEAKPVVKEAPTSNNSCSSSVPETEFDMIGTRNLNVTAYISGAKTEANRSVTIK